MDGILANLHQPWIDWYNKIWHDHLTLEEVTDWDIHKFTKPSCQKKMYDFLSQADLYKNVEPFDGAFKTLDKWSKLGHEIIIVSHAMGGPVTMTDKARWLDDFLPKGVLRENIVYTSQKHLLKLDVLVDDSPINLERQRQYWPNVQLLTLAFPHNLRVAEICDCRAQSYKNPGRAWEQLDAYLEGYTR